MKLAYLITLFTVSTLGLLACNSQEPAATGIKKQLSAGGVAAGTGDQAGTQGDPSATGGTKETDGTTTTPGTTTGGTTPGTATAPKVDANAGKIFFTTPARGCSGCHGVDGKGATPLNAPYDNVDFDGFKSLPSHAGKWPTVATDTANVLAFINSLAAP